MPKILITGNGFDLFHHLPTKYSHFLTVLKSIEKLKETKQPEEKKTYAFDDIFSNSFEKNYIDDYLNLKDNYQTCNFYVDKEKTHDIKEKCKTNLWYQYFKTRPNHETWIDFENEIKQLIITVSNCINRLEKNGCKGYFISLNDNQISNTVKLENTNEQNILKTFQISEKNSNFITEKYFNKYTFKFNQTEIFNTIYKELEDFISILDLYFKNIVSKFYDIRISKKELILPDDIEIHTFNYTPTFENFYKVDPKYLHGKISSEIENQNMVLGVDDIPEELKTYKLFSFTKYFQKLHKDTDFQFIKNDPNNVQQFYIIGHSLDTSDKEYIIKILDILKTNRNESILYIFYNSISDKANLLQNLLSYFDKTDIEDLMKTKKIIFKQASNNNINEAFIKKINNNDELFII